MDKFKAAKWLKDMVAKYLLGWLFEASCNKHDEGYEKGGNWIQKLYCDLRFFAAMVKDAGNLQGIHKQIPALIVALIYFVCVMLGGWLSFKFK